MLFFSFLWFQQFIQRLMNQWAIGMNIAVQSMYDFQGNGDNWSNDSTESLKLTDQPAVIQITGYDNVKSNP